MTETQKDSMEEIYFSIQNGQLEQMVEQIDRDFIQYDFWELFCDFLTEVLLLDVSTKYQLLKRAVIGYNRIKGR